MNGSPRKLPECWFQPQGWRPTPVWVAPHLPVRRKPPQVWPLVRVLLKWFLVAIALYIAISLATIVFIIFLLALVVKFLDAVMAYKRPG